MDKIELIGLGVVCGFALGWIASEAYRFYRDSKDRRWR